MRIFPVVLGAAITAALFSLSAPAHAQNFWVIDSADYDSLVSNPGTGNVTVGQVYPALSVSCDWYGGAAVTKSIAGIGKQIVRLDAPSSSPAMGASKFRLDATVNGNINGAGQLNPNGSGGGRSKVEVQESSLDGSADQIGYTTHILEDETSHHLSASYPEPSGNPGSTGDLDLVIDINGPFASGSLAELPGGLMSAEGSAQSSFSQTTSPGAHVVTRAWAIYKLYGDNVYFAGP